MNDLLQGFQSILGLTVSIQLFGIPIIVYFVSIALIGLVVDFLKGKK
jgi:hypothetical protein